MILQVRHRTERAAGQREGPPAAHRHEIQAGPETSGGALVNSKTDLKLIRPNRRIPGGPDLGRRDDEAAPGAAAARAEGGDGVEGGGARGQVVPEEEGGRGIWRRRRVGLQGGLLEDQGEARVQEGAGPGGGAQAVVMVAIRCEQKQNVALYSHIHPHFWGSDKATIASRFT